MTFSSEQKIRDKITPERTPRTEDAMLQTEPVRHRFTVEEYRRMGELGFFTEDDRVELIRGDLVDMNPIGISHAACVTTLTHVLVEKSRGRFFVSVQNSFGAVDESEPQPDFCLLRKRPSQADDDIPSGEGMFLAIEVSDTTLAYDRNVKLPLYAESGVPEVWIVDIKGKRVEVHSEPSSDGYKATRIFVSGEEAHSATVENLTVPVDGVMA